MTTIWRDLRSLEAVAADKRVAAMHADDIALVTAWQAARLAPHTPSPALAAMVPDFLNYARLINTGQARAMLALGGSLTRAAVAGLRASPAVLGSPRRTLSRDFWVVADALLRYDMGLLRHGLCHHVMLHPYLADFAFAFERRDIFSTLARLATAVGATPGTFTFQPAACLSCLARWNTPAAVIAFHGLPSPAASQPALAMAATSAMFDHTTFLFDVSAFPAAVQEQAVAAGPPHALLLGPA